MLRNYKGCKNYHVVTIFLRKIQLWILIGNPHHHQLKKIKRTENEKTAEFSKLLTVEKENFYYGGTSKF
ncbi:hypothetical protein COM00_21725 [Bacillus toyonensis]|uniref:Transposase n=1 Tax=Bacillus toyonensis TaxID=155322 RepID=A0AB73S6K9_9BACI|nr:hypothetical protein CN678_19650 [Bacillus toyonensis]PEL51468.1 hypothetical protein CN638_13230 [Bacillus toyonensis]PGB58832.1 hypothetical protein COM00_21725 [Bacillus toyonensis]